MKQRPIVFLAPIVLFLAACPLMNMSQSSPQPSAAGSTNAAVLTIVTDTTRNQGVLVTGSGAKVDITSVSDDGTVVNCVDASSIAPVSDGSSGSSARSLSLLNSVAIIVGTRSDGNPGAWVYSSNKINSVIDEDSGQATSRLPETSEQNGVFKGQFGWVYHVMGVSEDGKVIIGYAINARGISLGKLQIDPGTTVGVYWKLSRHPVRPLFMVSEAHIIGTLDLSKVPNTPHRGVISFLLKHVLDQLKLFFINYLSSYLVMVDKNGIHFDATNNVYLVTGTDQDDVPATATIDQKGNITIAENPVSQAPNVYAAGYYGTPTVACYWVNGTKTDLPGDGNPAHASSANSMYVSGSNIYVAGSYFNGTTTVACYWVNGTKTDLPGDGTGTNPATAYSIFVSGGTIYTAGYYNNAGTLTACYWTGTTKTDLPGTNGAIADAIFVSGTTVYTAGQYEFLGTPIACYWMGTTKTDLPGTNSANAQSIFVSGTTVYTAGEYNQFGTSVACYWTGTTKQDLPGTAGSALSIFVSAGTIYTAGQNNPGTGLVACYWTGAKQD